MEDKGPIDRFFLGVYKFVAALVGIQLALVLIEPILPALVVVGFIAFILIMLRRGR